MTEWFIGLMSGTSMDGIDAALVSFEPQPRLQATHTRPYPEALRRELLALARPGENEVDRLGAADVLVGREFAAAANTLLAQARVAASRVRAVGSHGQTVRHRPGTSPAFTLQIGDPNTIAADTGLPVVADFRRKDMALGGQGAPLVPAFHEAVFRTAERDRVVVNIGGIANLTVLPRAARGVVSGFDTGPGNTLLDTWSRRVLGQPMDRDGALAARGRVVAPLLGRMLADPYFSARPPKSTGPEYFTPAWLDRHLGGAAVEAADVQATLVALTARSIADAVRPDAGAGQPEVFVCGGGARNPVLMQALAAELPGCPVARTDALGVEGDWVEAMAFAWLAQRHLARQTGNCPAVTGARRAAVLGGLWLPD